MLGRLLTGILGTGAPSEASGELRETIRDLRSELKELRRDVDDLDERFAAFKGRVDKRRGVARAADATEEAPHPSPGDSRHPEVVAILRRRGEG